MTDSPMTPLEEQAFGHCEAQGLTGKHRESGLLTGFILAISLQNHAVCDFIGLISQIRSLCFIV